MVKHLIVLACLLGGTLAGSIQETSNKGEKIVGGQIASAGQYPHQVSLRSNQNRHFCGGSIFSTVWILTAAHCVNRQTPSAIQVVVGTNTLNSGGVHHPVSQIIVHALYNPQNNYNDIAVVRLATPITFTNLALPIALATSATPGGLQCWLSGWGLTSYPSSQIPNSLQHIALTSISIGQCQQNLPGYPISSGHVCTLAPRGQGACEGDSGGPLISQGVQHGVVSWGIPCAVGNPDVFTSVAYYRDWIKSNTGI